MGGREALATHTSAPEVEEAICHETPALLKSLRAPCTAATRLRGCGAPITGAVGRPSPGHACEGSHTAGGKLT